MKIFNIFTVANQQQYRKEDFVMILAHIVEKGLYDAENLKTNIYTIMDNGVYEKARVSESLADLIALASKQEYNISEIVIPDVIGDYEATKQLYKDNYDVACLHKHNYCFMYVAQASNLDQLKDAIEMVNNEKNLRLVLGIPKNSPFSRTSKETIEVLKTCKVPIHFLGIRENYKELLPVKDIIRSCDSIQMSYVARDYSVQDKNLIEKTRVGAPIDLIKDAVNDTKIDLTRVVINKELKSFGIL